MDPLVCKIAGAVALLLIVGIVVYLVIKAKKEKFDIIKDVDWGIDELDNLKKKENFDEYNDSYYESFDEPFKMTIRKKASDGGAPASAAPVTTIAPIPKSAEDLENERITAEAIAEANARYNVPGDGTEITPPVPAKENFVLSTQPVKISPVTGAIVGSGIMTNQMTRMPLSELTNQVNTNGYVTDGAISIGVAVGEGFDKVYQNQLDIQTIDDKAVGGYQQREDLTSISHKIGSNNNNANFNLFSRGGSTPTKLLLAPNEVRCVVDEKYIPERDKNHQIATVGTVIPMQGYDVNVERMGEMLLDTHFSTYSSNKPKKRIQTKAAATTVKESPNAKVVNEEIKTNGEVAVVKDATEGADVAVKIDNRPETFTKYAAYA